MNILKELRTSKGLYQKDLAQYLGIDRTTYVKYERGDSEPNFETVQKLADYFGVTVDYLIGRSKEKYPAPGISEENVRFPVIGDIAAGFDRIVLESWDGDIIDVPLSYLKGRSKEEFFVLRVKGESMYPIYLDGDRVLILKQDTVDYSGQVAAVLYDDDLATLKRVEYTTGESMRLIAINPNIPPIKLEGERLNHCRILGIPKILIRDIEN